MTATMTPSPTAPTVTEVLTAGARAEQMDARAILRTPAPPIFVRLRGGDVEVLDEDAGHVLTLPGWLAGLHVFGRQAQVDALIVSLVGQVEATAKRCLTIGRRQKELEVQAVAGLTDVLPQIR